MKLLRTQRISSKIVAVLALFALLCAGLVGLGAYNFRIIAAGTQDLVEHHAESLRLAASAKQHITMMQQVAFELIVVKPRESGDLQATFDDEGMALDADLESLKAVLDRGELPGLEAIAKAAGEYRDIVNRSRGFEASGQRASAEDLLLSKGVTAYDGVDIPLAALLDHEKEDLAKAAAAAQDQADAALMQLLGISILGLIAVSTLALLIVRRGIAAPLTAITKAMNGLAAGDLQTDAGASDRADEIGDLAKAFVTFRQAIIEGEAARADAQTQRQLVEDEQKKHFEAQAQTAQDQSQVVGALALGLTQMAAGDLGYRLSQSFPAAYEKLRQDFNAAMHQLQDAMQSIKASVRGIRAGTDEISQSAEDLSRRTEQQAASLEESAAALGEITAAVRRTAEGASEANGVVAATKADAEKSGKIMHSAVGAMNGIDQSARRIAQIIGVIDEIAFQTNLLALNAGVEAARAGDAGRGFAVVASEVRALAQRSAGAAKEIKALISTSTDQVSAGVQLVGQTGQALDRIVINIGEINKLVGEIASSAKEQAAGLHEINSSIDQMDQMTQQNASMVEESTAASFTLASESQALADLLDHFKIDDAAAPIVTRRARAPAPIHLRNAPAPVRRSRASDATARKLEPVDAEWEEF